MNGVRFYGYRKYSLTVLALLLFAVILILHPAIEPFWLGFGLALLLAPACGANIFEHLNKV